MIDPIPSGTRDVLPDEMRELRAITETVRAVFDARGYGEVATPALEYESTLARGDAAAAEPAYRLFDEQGNVLVLRSDMTIPIARVVATRYATSAPPLRFCYFAHAYRSVRPQRGQAREMLQAGIELVGAPGPDGTIEAIELLCEVLDSVGLDSYRVGLGDASLYPALLDALGVPAAARAPILNELVTRDFVGLEREIEGLRLADEASDLLLRVPQLRGGPEVLELPAGPARRRRRPAQARSTSASRRAWRSGSSSTSGCRGRWATTRARSSRSTTARSACRWAAAGATTTCSRASGASCRPRAGRSTSSGSTSRLVGASEASERGERWG